MDCGDLVCTLWLSDSIDTHPFVLRPQAVGLRSGSVVISQCSSVAPMVERLSCKQVVGSSTLPAGTTSSQTKHSRSK